MSPLSPETRELLKTVRPSEPFFSNMILAELFEDQNSRGPFKILPFAGGGYLLFDTRALIGKGVVDRFEKIVDAQAALRLLPEENVK